MELYPVLSTSSRDADSAAVTHVSADVSGVQRRSSASSTHQSLKIGKRRSSRLTCQETSLTVCLSGNLNLFTATCDELISCEFVLWSW